MEKRIAHLRLERGKLEQAEGLAQTGRNLGLVAGCFGVVLSFSEWNVVGLFMVSIGIYLIWHQGCKIQRTHAQVMVLNTRIMELRQKVEEGKDVLHHPV